ncbi:hypothetical protein SAMN04489735_104410 [Aneurinibacillus thermoaerophilus]|uniref:Uncharacterized protein n=1 Tax=Aneurinibacillus thermoaerophilus TaxID=143495 RepID=A0A1G8EHG4_ANETH|nr:hypothetical protein SAMN04489735_104410 [Aneurinibacillus thermoaerophilus]
MPSSKSVKPSSPTNNYTLPVRASAKKGRTLNLLYILLEPKEDIYEHYCMLEANV